MWDTRAQRAYTRLLAESTPLSTKSEGVVGSPVLQSGVHLNLSDSSDIYMDVMSRLPSLTLSPAGSKMD